MSISPVDSFPPVKSVQAATANVSLDGSTRLPDFGAPEDTSPPVSGTVPRQQVSTASNVSSGYEFPQDVVELHQDPDVKDLIIAEYLDQSKQVVMQVPSSEELAVERGIAQELQQRDLQQAAKLNANASTAVLGSEGENSHGN